VEKYDLPRKTPRFTAGAKTHGFREFRVGFRLALFISLGVPNNLCQAQYCA